ncbi:M48 family metalloprotease [Spirosoma spitsbergense]|uniref:M48 family metalloprotease n=1 Tax=Spirosoma spitsbergense TaxID=431554 RepID=UPI00037903C4
MKKSLALLLIFGLVIACQRVPMTGRKQLIIIGSDQMLPLSAGQYKEVLNTSQVVRSGPDYEMISRVGNRLRVAVENYLNSNNYGERIKGYQWEFNLIQSPQQNAWCMAGGKVAFYTGILPYTRNEAGVATVMGHEIAHAIAAHNEERMSETLLANGLLQSGQILINDLSPPQKRQANLLLLEAAGITYQLGRALPHSRAQESEADHLGLIFMALAGYDPQQAVVFWQRFSMAGNGQKPPELLSTHPSDERRIRDLQNQMPEAMKYYTVPKSIPIALHPVNRPGFEELAETNAIEKRVQNSKVKAQKQSINSKTSAKNQTRKGSSQATNKKTTAAKNAQYKSNTSKRK